MGGRHFHWFTAEQRIAVVALFITTRSVSKMGDKSVSSEKTSHFVVINAYMQGSEENGLTSEISALAKC